MHTEEMEKEVILLCLKDKTFLSEVYDRMSPNHFSKHTFKWLFWACKEYFRKYGDRPPKAAIINEIKKSSKLKLKNKAIYLRITEDLYSSKPKARGYTKDEVEEYMRAMSFIQTLNGVVDEVGKGNQQKAYDMMLQELFKSETDKSYRIVNWLAEFDKRQKIRKERSLNPLKNGGVPLPYKCLHPFIDVIQPGEIGSITALTSSGKSIMLGEIGADAMLNDFNVVHFVLENTEWQAAQRYDSRILGIPYDDLKRYSFTKKQSKQIDRNIKAIKKYIGEKLMIVKLPQQGTSVISIEKALRDLEVTKGFYAQLITLDYADIMEPAKKYESFRLSQAGVYWDIKALADDRNIPLWTATQAPQELGKPDKKGNIPILKAESTGEAYWKARILDIILTIYQSLKNKLVNQVVLHIAKNRDGRRGIEFTLKEDFANMRFLEI